MAKILIVEDEVIQAMNTKMLLEDMGHDVIGVAERAETAFDLANEYRPDIVLSDILIKGEIAGIELAMAICRKHGCRIIFMTGSPESLTKDIKESGVLKKPFDRESLCHIIDEAMDS